MRPSIVLRDSWRILTFRRPSAAVAGHPDAFAVFGLLCAWLAGIGRYWDHPDARLWQYLGLGSVLYVLLLASLLWLLLWPICVRRLRWQTVLIFVALTSPLAWLYAIPVERFMHAGAAAALNAQFLLVVAVWRVILLVLFLRRVARLSAVEAAVLGLFPLTMIVAVLAMLNLEHATFNIMAGLGDPVDPRGLSYFVVQLLALGSLIAAPILLIAYVVLWRNAAQERAYLRKSGLPPG